MAIAPTEEGHRARADGDAPARLSAPSRALRTALRVIRSLSGELSSRSDYAARTGSTYNGQRDLYRALGYRRSLSPADYRLRYERGDIAETIVEAYPRAAWSGGVDIIENEDVEVTTQFEQAVSDLNDKLDLWARVLRADILAGLGHYSILLIGAPVPIGGSLESPLGKLQSLDDLLYLTPLPQERAKILSLVTDVNNPLFGLPEFYSVYLGTPISSSSIDSSTTSSALSGATRAYRVHHTRVIHIAEGLLVDDVYGKPRLRDVWNKLDDLDKIVGGGAEASWSRADPGLHIDFDSDKEFDDGEEEELEEEIEEYRHGLKRTLQTQGAKVSPLMSNVSTFGPNADTIIKLISATKRIPHRILVGSERGELSSTQDKDNWSDRVTEYRQEHTTPLAKRIINRFIECGALPQPKSPFTVVYPDVESVNAKDKASTALLIAQSNSFNAKAGAGLILTGAEIRDTVYGKGPLPVEDDISSGSSTDTTDDNPIDPAVAP